MSDIFRAFDDRAHYLNCIKYRGSTAATRKIITGGDKGGGKVGFASEGGGQSGGQQGTTAPQTITLTTLKANKQQQEDQAVTLIKNILS